MNYHAGWVLGVVLALAGVAQGQQGGVADRGGAPGMGGGFGWGGGAYFEGFIMTVTQLNMTPEFTLDAPAKEKLLALRDEFRAASAKYFADHRADFEKIQKEQMDAYKAKDVDDIKLAAKKMQDFYAGGPKNEDYIAKAKSLLTADQLKVLEAHLAKAEQDRAAQMARWKRMQEDRQGANPGAPVGPKDAGGAKNPGSGGL